MIANRLGYIKIISALFLFDQNIMPLNLEEANE
jgi:hypothetical protein